MKISIFTYCLISFFFTIIFSSCFAQSTFKNGSCGIVMTKIECNVLKNKISKQPQPYEADTLWSLYDQINDSIRAAIPDSLEIEVFLVLLNTEEIGISVLGPPAASVFETSSCILMNAKFTGNMPQKRYLLFNTYNEQDGSVEDSLEFAIKRN